MLSDYKNLVDINYIDEESLIEKSDDEVVNIEEKSLLNEFLRKNHVRNVESRILDFSILLIMLFIILESLAIFAIKTHINIGELSQSQIQTINTLHIIFQLLTRLLVSLFLLLFIFKVINVSILNEQFDKWCLIEVHILDYFTKSLVLFIMSSLDCMINENMFKSFLHLRSIHSQFALLEQFVTQTTVIDDVWIISLSILGLIFLANRFVKKDDSIKI